MATVTNTRVRTSTPRKLKIGKKSSPRPVLSTKASAPSTSAVEKVIPNNNHVTASTSEAAAVAVPTVSKNLLGPLLSAQFSKLGLNGLRTDAEFNQVVSSLAEDIINKGKSGGGQLLKEPAYVNQIWDDVVNAVNVNVSDSWTEKFVKMQKPSLIKQIQEEKSTVSPYLRFSNGLFDVDKRFLRPSTGIYQAGK